MSKPGFSLKRGIYFFSERPYGETILDLVGCSVLTVKPHGFAWTVTPLFVLDKNPARAIKDNAIKEKIDLLVTGARGRNATAAVLLGSVTEQLVWKTKTPIIAVKKKGTGMNFLKALLEI